MSVFVVDASLTGAWLLEDERTSATEALFIRAYEAGCHAPFVWPAEVEQILVRAERRGRLHPLLAFDGRMRVREVETVVHHEQAELRALDAAQLARSHRLSVYDALYLELALRLQLPLATLDRRLRQATQDAGVLVLPD